jgi:ATP-dependent RNA helicase DeaD
MTTDTTTTFSQLGLPPALLKALDDVGYETPSPIQAQTIPLMLKGRDVVGQAQTGTGKTAAFALPILANLNMKQKNPQVLVLAPTRELAIQVAEAFQKYAHHMKGFHVLPIYGGQDYSVQIRALKRGVHVAVGTPGRVMDHIRKGSLVLNELSTLVLDEGDEMLRMGFIDDVEWILDQTPKDRQIALFSATMPQQIRRIATRYLNDPAEITVKVSTTTAETIRQRFWPVQGFHKLDALTRILEAEPFDAMLIFVRTKLATVDLAEKLEARGYACSALNGDIQQKQRERTIDHLKKGKLDILVATDVAARGLDVSRISHVVNYDIPTDTESYVHRIGRTGRAGRQGDAILFVAPREKRLLYAIENATRKKIELMELPSTDEINNRRIEKFKQRISDTLASEDLSLFTKLLEKYQKEHDVSAIEIAAALAQLSQGEAPFLLQNKPQHSAAKDWQRDDKSDRGASRGAKRGPPADRDAPPSEGMQRYRLSIGHDHGVMPGNIVGAIANEANISGKNIGRINIHDDYSLIDLPSNLPEETLIALKKIWVAGNRLGISKFEEGSQNAPQVERKSFKDRRAEEKKTRKPRHKTNNKRGKAKRAEWVKAEGKPKRKPARK